MSEVDAVAEYARAAKRRRFTIIAAVCVIAASPIVYLVWKSHSITKSNEKHSAEAEAYANRPLEPFESKRFESIAAQMKDDALTLRPAWEAAVNSLAAVEPSDGTCPYHMRAPTSEAAQSYAHGSIDANYIGNVHSQTFERNTPLADAWIKDQLGREASLVAGPRDRQSYERVVKVREPFVFVVADTTPAFVDAPTNTYRPGSIVGKAYVFDLDRKKIICEAAIDVTNDPNLDVKVLVRGISVETEGAVGTLARDLDIQLQRQLVANLRSTF